MSQWWKAKNKVRLPVFRTISVGNLSLGGTGKTPMTLAIAELLQECLPTPDLVILTRGYKSLWSKNGGVVEVTSDPQNAGDEPLLLKQNLPQATVLVGQDRIAQFQKYYLTSFAGKNESHSHLHGTILLLDDGFQHVQIERDLDIVLIDSTSLLGNGFTLPVGRLRERVSALARAQVLVFTRFVESRQSQEQKDLENFIRKCFPQLTIFHACEESAGFWYKVFHHESGGEQSQEFPASELIGAKVTAFAGLGNPHPFFTSIGNIVGREIRTHSLPDHCDYQPETIEKILSDDSQYWICTEKDAVKFCPEDWERFQGRLLYLKIRIRICEPDSWKDFWQTFLARGNP